VGQLLLSAAAELALLKRAMRSLKLNMQTRSTLGMPHFPCFLKPSRVDARLGHVQDH
jgi:hypothetical protein